MITITATNSSGAITPLTDILTFKFNSTLSTPTDSVTVTFNSAIDTTITSMYIKLDDAYLFQGSVDKIEIKSTEYGFVSVVNLRDKFAFLLDNEVKPCVYLQLTSTELIKIYGEGIITAQLPYVAQLDDFTVSKGSSNWAVISDFCTIAYGKTPYILNGNTLTVDPLSSTVHNISTHGTIPYTSLEHSFNKTKLFGEVHMRTATESSGFYYGLTFSNNLGKDNGVYTQRYFHPTSALTRYGTNEVEQLIDEANRQYEQYTVVIPSLLSAYAGDRCSIKDVADDLYIEKLDYSASDSGLQTTLLLQKSLYI